MYEREGMRIGTISGFAIALLAIGSAYAQTPNRWLSACVTDERTEKKECVAMMLVDPGRAPEEMLTVSVILPMGAVVVIGSSDGADGRVRIDDRSPVRTSVCQRKSCVVLPERAGELIGQMRSGTKIFVEFTTEEGKKIGPWEASLAGFEAEYRHAEAQASPR
jgi:invasion protein IalB